MSRRHGVDRRSLLSGGFLCLALPVLARAASPGFQPIALHARPIETFLPSLPKQVFGPLQFRGGLELSSPDRRFGSLSGLDFASDGTLYAVSDRGRWFAARPVTTDGRLTGLEDGRVAPMLNNAGIPLSGKAWGDAEGFRIDKDGSHDVAYVTFEGVNDMRRFDGPDFAISASHPVDLPGAVRSLPRNTGLEALAIAPASGPLGGAFVVIAEEPPRGSDDHRGWIVGGPKAGSFEISGDSDYGITDAAFLPDGDLLILERALSFPFGFTMRIRRIAGEELASGAVVAAETLVAADLRFQIDNMEGLAVHVNEQGETIIAIVSDDNGSPLQRTLLLYFALIG
ncbi:MAG: esterase-like activity of phytase family protein [Bauldia sp.]|uniref:esterase-like activity of phytase family protein n=1 Tax=Bauldia sp. TaxID=2575872 RepID=UPI001D9E1916|nr:esterase-like activity of phytase family protein [Bauldia sp.]MCB1495580.1 esterase-like activity of phytase family protein [Bauldia sp.]